MNFKDLKISDELIDTLKKNGIKTPTPIQEESILHIKNNKDILAQSQTGTGKTLAFLIPIFDSISPKNQNIQALILAPTRELAIQIYNEAEKLNKDKNINILAAYGGKDIKSQLNKLKRNIQLVIATPGRLLDHLDRKSIDLSKLNTLVLDEADQMILMGFKNEIEAIIKETNKKRQTLCFSATLDSQVKKLAYRYMKDPVEVTIKSKEITLETIKQEVVETTDRHKQEALCKVLDEDNPFMAIIFCRTKRRVDALDEALAVKVYNCEKLHSDIPQAKRERNIKSFRKADLQYLIATDVASRGLDITGITHIYNYDIPETSEDYIHRIGRTGRIGNDGYTFMFVDHKNTKTLEKIESDIKYEIPRRLVELDK